MASPTHPRSSVVLWERSATAGRYSIDNILTSNAGGFTLTADDFLILRSLLRYNYVSSRQLDLLAGHDVHKRISALFDLGLIDRAWFSYRTVDVMVTREDLSPDIRTKQIKERAQALTAKGLDLLVATDDDLAKEWEGEWNPKSETSTLKNSLAHELGRNDFCVAVIEAAEARKHPVIDWRGPREAFHRYSPGSGAPALLSEPDSVLILSNGQPLLIEYERSGRIDRFYKKMIDTQNYLVSGGWKQRFGPTRPWVIYAIPSGIGTQGRASGTYGGLLSQAITGNAIRYALVDQFSWESRSWDAATPDGKVVPLWNLVLGKD